MSNNKIKKDMIMQYFRMMFGIDEIGDEMKSDLKNLDIMGKIDLDYMNEHRDRMKQGTDKYFLIELMEIAVDTVIKESDPKEEFLDIEKVMPLYLKLLKSQIKSIYEMTPLYIKEDLKNRMN